MTILVLCPFITHLLPRRDRFPGGSSDLWAPGFTFVLRDKSVGLQWKTGWCGGIGHRYVWGLGPEVLVCFSSRLLTVLLRRLFLSSIPHKLVALLKSIPVSLSSNR